MKALVTGAAGFIGSHLAKVLEDKEYELRLVDDFSKGKESYLKYLGVKTHCIYMDLAEYNSYNQGYFEEMDEVYHCACRIGNNEYLHGSSDKKLKALQDNLAIDRNVFKYCHDENVKKIIYTSSVSVYNSHRQNTLKEAMFSESDFNKDICPEGGYGWAKYIGEIQLGYMPKTNVGVARIFKSYGPCDDYSDVSGQVVTSLMRKAINYPKEKFILWGDGQVTRCLVYIDDLIDGLLKLSKYCNNKSLTVNLGGNEPYKISMIANKIINISGKRINVENDMSKNVGAKSRIPDLTLAKEELNWEPKTSLNEGLKKTFDWVKYDISESQRGHHHI